MAFRRLTIVIPTRNRPELAISAIRSVLDQGEEGCDVVLSDNSTDELAVRDVRVFCESVDDDKLSYIRPDRPLTMTDHWNWAMSKITNRQSTSHVAFLSDRFVFLNESLSILASILRQRSVEIVSYATVSLDDSTDAVTLHQKMWTGQVCQVESAKMIWFYSRLGLSESFPRMLNCAVPVEFMRSTYEAYGNYFSSVAPDFNFAGRVLDSVDSFLYYDKPLFVNYGLGRSGGRNVLSGNFQKDAKDFISNLESTSVNFPTPVNDIRIMPNAVMHEYYDAKARSRTGKFPEMDRSKYLESLVGNVFAYQNEEMRTKWIDDLTAELGWTKVVYYRIRWHLRRYSTAARIKIHDLLHPGDPYVVSSSFDKTEAALEFAKANLRPHSTTLRFAQERLGIRHPGLAAVVLSPEEIG